MMRTQRPVKGRLIGGCDTLAGQWGLEAVERALATAPDNLQPPLLIEQWLPAVLAGDFQPGRPAANRSITPLEAAERRLAQLLDRTSYEEATYGDVAEDTARQLQDCQDLIAELSQEATR